ncbi:hypothetical protein [Candidatus Igneacidithiobacillus taiwanensis]|uniref:hypothetical protein n=1 Tax=Candidatus Igneacidithiobacillus taiwanensis TaxID=1945924 RepID=UPI00289F712F|nr:hypothetical protein [Candidatus Igneacidithiobacillus taiwanensis]
MSDGRPQMLFPLGTILLSPDAQSILEAGDIDPQEILRRHVTGDWEESMDEDLRRASLAAIQEGGIIVSTWQIGGYTLWVRTDAARSSTVLDIPLDH